MSELRARPGGADAEALNRAARAREEAIVSKFEGKRNWNANQRVPKDDSRLIGGERHKEQSRSMVASMEAQEAEHARRKEAKRAEAARRLAEEDLQRVNQLAKEEEEARRRAADPEYAAARMAEDEAAAVHRLAVERQAIYAEFATAEERAKQEAAKHTQAVSASLELLEQEKQRREQERSKERVAKEKEEQMLLSYSKAKEVLARKEQAQKTVPDAQSRAPVKMSLKKKSLL